MVTTAVGRMVVVVWPWRGCRIISRKRRRPDPGWRFSIPGGSGHSTRHRVAVSLCCGADSNPPSNPEGLNLWERQVYGCMQYRCTRQDWLWLHYCICLIRMAGKEVGKTGMLWYQVAKGRTCDGLPWFSAWLDWEVLRRSVKHTHNDFPKGLDHKAFTLMDS